MRKVFILLILGLPLVTLHAQSDYFSQIQSERDSTDRFFADSTTTVLEVADTASFDTLAYFPIQLKYKVTGKFKKFKRTKPVVMKTSGTRTPLYEPYGIVTFVLDGKKHKLTLYRYADPSRPELRNYVLCAFTDLTNGFETYGGGRYLDFTIDELEEEITLDFNRCYNPYCAYNHKYSCVIPPAENQLKVRIEAGVKKFHD